MVSCSFGARGHNPMIHGDKSVWFANTNSFLNIRFVFWWRSIIQLLCLLRIIGRVNNHILITVVSDSRQVVSIKTEVWFNLWVDVVSCSVFRTSAEWMKNLSLGILFFVPAQLKKSSWPDDVQRAIDAAREGGGG